MTITDPTVLHAAVELTGGLLYTVTALVILAGLLVVALSFRPSHRN